jgi:hypothetical protein
MSCSLRRVAKPPMSRGGASVLAHKEFTRENTGKCLGAYGWAVEWCRQLSRRDLCEFRFCGVYPRASGPDGCGLRSRSSNSALHFPPENRPV